MDAVVSELGYLRAPMKTDEPRVRAPLTKAILEVLERQPRDVQVAVRARAKVEITRVEECSRVDWIPLGVQLAILDGVREELGIHGYEDFCAAHFASTVEQPFVRGMFDTTVRLFGLGPAAVLRVFPKTWATISQGCGEVVIEEIDPNGTIIRVRELPVSEPRIELFVQGFRATFRGIIDLFRRPGDVELVSYDRVMRESVYRAVWS